MSLPGDANNIVCGQSKLAIQHPPVTDGVMRLPGCRLNMNANAQGLLQATPEAGDYVPHQAPHPARGSDTHRIVAVVVEHAGPCPVTGQVSIENRRMDIRNLLGGEDAAVVLVGYQFFRTCWTAKVSEAFKKMGIPQSIDLYTRQPSQPRF